jgi:predicted TIM-barrel fold metal-dependent hydrolase
MSEVLEHTHSRSYIVHCPRTEIQMVHEQPSDDRVLIISSDGHAMAKMADYRPYLPAEYHEDFDEFLKVYRVHGSDLGAVDPKLMKTRFDADVLEDWTKTVVEPGKLAGISDPVARLDIMGKEGVAAEVLFPDFGLPFELAPRTMIALGMTRSAEHTAVALPAHNRWLADFCATAPDRFAGMASVSFDDVDAAVREIHWAKEAGLRGVVLPAFHEEAPLYHERHDAIWATLAELEMPANTHVFTSPTTTRALYLGAEPHIGAAYTMWQAEVFFVARRALSHFIWGGVLERHPSLKVVFTEQGSGWVPGALEGMDFKWERSFMHRGVRGVIKHKPSEYYERQMYVGSSIFSRPEIETRHQIGVSKMMLGMDYPHHEGTWGVGPGTLAYLQATLGAASVPAAEAEVLLSKNAEHVFGFSAAALDPVRRAIGLSMSDVLTPPEADYYPRGDVHKPIGA